MLKCVIHVFNATLPWAWSSKHLTVAPDPLVGDPLRPDHDRAATMLDQVVVPAVLVHVPPHYNTSLFWLDKSPNKWKYSITACGHIRKVTHESSQPVPSIDIEDIPCLK